jgi:glycosyltransferase involved in cell wall biosynthesis
MAAKRIAILGSRGIPARYGGFETFAEQIAIRLQKAGIDVTVFCEQQDDGQPPRYEGVSLEYVPVLQLGPLTTILFDLRCLCRARKGFDVVYMLGYGASLFCFIPRLWGSVVWINMDGVEWARSKWNWLAKSWFVAMEAIAMWTANRVIADAHSIRSHLESRHRRVPACSVIAYGADIVDYEPDTSLLQQWGLVPREYYLVVCRLEPENHVKEIIDGFAASASTYPLIILGNHQAGTPYVGELLQIKDDRIRFVGTVYDSSSLQALRWHCRAYFHGHSAGGTNPSLLEALGCGNLIIAHDNPFNREVAGNGAKYFSFAREVPEHVAEADQHDAFENTRRASQNRISEHYTWESITEQYVNLLSR